MSIVILETSSGNITIKLNHQDAPISVENFLSYVDAEFYNDTIFHRVIPGFMVQGGGMNEDMSEKETQEPIKNEAENGLKNIRGTLAMARTQVVDSATSQFFINLSDNVFLDNGSRDFGYAVFAEVIEGMDVVDQIAKTPTGNYGTMGDVPSETITILTIRRADQA